MTDCPRCEAKPGDPCRGKRGQELNWQHASRTEASPVPATTGPAATAPAAGPVQPVTFHEIPGMRLWHAKRGRTYLGTISHTRAGEYMPVANGRAYQPKADLESAQRLLLEKLA
jgi:hypothetical protein